MPLPLLEQDPPPIWFHVPDGFYALPLAATPEERAEKAEEFVRGLYSQGDERVWEPAAPYYAGLAELMADTGVSYSAMGLFSTAEEDGDGDSQDGAKTGHNGADGVAQCAFTVAAVPTDQASGDTETVAQGILAVLSTTPHNDARWLDLPCGPAVSCVTLTEYKLNPEITTTGEPTDLLTGQIQVHVPFPTGPFTAIFTLHTASTDYWTEFCNIMSAILQTVSFTEPEEGEAA
ncbi:hypothetical protein [Streptomyces formicae]|uniref:Uncharacterized protein n=1 Tax=Streptomyces formicae TaxID=1616117 RepID=A0A291QBG3_9ACTN|nr:hypothetical protein [Streptomyces formicae]ATL28846.1 hypothetical protein KY5_3828 [Streptomyces formicae]